MAFAGCDSLTSVFFRGNVPSQYDEDIGFFDTTATIYYLPGTTGWGDTFGDRPAKLWNPIFTAVRLGPGALSCTVTGTANIPVGVEACPDLLSDQWLRLQTTNLTGGVLEFRDSDATGHPSRYYRIAAP